MATDNAHVFRTCDGCGKNWLLPVHGPAFCPDCQARANLAEDILEQLHQERQDRNGTAATSEA